METTINIFQYKLGKKNDNIFKNFKKGYKN